VCQDNIDCEVTSRSASINALFLAVYPNYT
jgi:hypothetical protein